jgi:hypothetical protein
MIVAATIDIHTYTTFSVARVVIAHLTVYVHARTQPFARLAPNSDMMIE